MNRYKLKEGSISVYCDGKYDYKENKFVENNSIEKIKCCRSNCIDDIKYCREYCKNNDNNKDCFNNCDYIQKLCDFVCLRIDSEGIKNIKNCAENKGCSIFSNKSCLKLNKDDIINCCKERCKNEEKKTEDCQNKDICENVFEYLLEEIKTFERKEDEKIFMDMEMNWIKMIIIGLILIFIIIIFYKMKK